MLCLGLIQLYWKIFGEEPIADSDIKLNAQGFNEGAYTRASKIHKIRGKGGLRSEFWLYLGGKMSFFKTVEGKHTVSTTIYHGVGAKIPIAVFCDVDYLWWWDDRFQKMAGVNVDRAW